MGGFSPRSSGARATIINKVKNRHAPCPPKGEKAKKKGAKECWVDIEINPNTAADAGDLLVFSKSVEFLHAGEILALLPRRGVLTYRENPNKSTGGDPCHGFRQDCKCSCSWPGLPRRESRPTGSAPRRNFRRSWGTQSSAI